MNDWIENLKVGDYVFVSWRMGTFLRKVEKITPKGNIKVNGIMFNKNGSERGGDVWSKCYLHEATPESIKEFQNEITVKKAIKLMREIKTISLEQANKIIELLDHPTEKGETERQIQTAKTMIEKMVSCYDKTEKGGAQE